MTSNHLAALETSGRPGSVAVWSPRGLQGARLADTRRHASDLLPALDALLAAADLAPRDLDAVCVGIGPGSYTGLRVGVATALGLARSTGAALRAVPSLEALVLDVAEAGRACAVALDARADGYYYARYVRLHEQSLADVRVEEPACVLTRAELLARLGPAPYGIVDAGVRELLRTEGVELGALCSEATPSATAVARLGRTRLERDGPSRPEDCEPLYLRPFVVRSRRTAR